MSKHQAWHQDGVHVTNNAEDSRYWRKNVPIDALERFVVVEVVGFPVRAEWLANQTHNDDLSNEEARGTSQSGPDRVEPAPAVCILCHSSVEQKY